MDEWKVKLFSEGGRKVLIKAVIQAIPTYAMSCFRIPSSINNEIEGMCANFWWGSSSSGKKIHWKAWSKLKQLKAVGGLGFKDLTYFNKALLAKQVWRIIENPDLLVARILKARYFKHTDVMNASLGHKPSYIWRSMLWSRDIINLGSCWRVGNGERINTRRDFWIPSLAGGKIKSNITFDSNSTVQNLINNQGD